MPEGRDVGAPVSGQLRRSPLTGAWTIVAPGREARPVDRPGAAAVCPFCEGNEGLTPPELEAVRPGGGAPDTPGWTVRVVPNKYPVLDGMHEVVVHSPSHKLTLATLPVAHVAEVLSAYQRRIAAQCGAGAAAVVPVMNHGPGSGASLAHPHSQIFATPIVPPALVDEAINFAQYRTKYGGCLLCDVIDTARRQQARLVLDGPVVAFTPEAPRWPYELWLAPADHQPDFRVAAASAVAGALQRALVALAAATGDAPHNYWLHTQPCAADGPFHWHIEAAARLTTPAGFELGTGIAVDNIDPARAAAALREALPPASGGA